MVLFAITDDVSYVKQYLSVWALMGIPPDWE